jgi:hypothetical protein
MTELEKAFINYIKGNTKNDFSEYSKASTIVTTFLHDLCMDNFTFYKQVKYSEYVSLIIAIMYASQDSVTDFQKEIYKMKDGGSNV